MDTTKKTPPPNEEPQEPIFEPSASEEQKAPPEEPKEEATKKYFMPIDEMISLKDESPPIPMVWNGIKVGSFGFVYGPSKSGKTIFCENLGLSIAAGETSFMGLPIGVEKQKVLFISLEEFWANRTERNAKQVNAMKGNGAMDFEENYLVINEMFPRNLRTAGDWNVLRDVIADSEAKIVIIDSLTRMNSGIIEDSATAEELCSNLRTMTYVMRITMIIVHHSTKQRGDPLTIDSLAGSRVVSQEADFIIGINKVPSGIRYCKDVAFRYYQENDETVTVFEINDSCLLVKKEKKSEASLLYDSSVDGRRDATNKDLVLETIIETADSEKKVNTRDLIANLVKTEIMSRPTFYSCIKKLVAEGKLGKGKEDGEYILI